MRVLGIDPAAAGPTGFGVVETDGRAYRVLEFGVLRHARKARAEQRLAAVHELIERLVRKFSPDAVALEAVFTALNMKTALKLAEVRGVVLLAAEQQHVPVHSYAPREVKAHVAGYGHADKRQMQQMVRVLLNLREAPQPTDAADALAAELNHFRDADLDVKRRIANLGQKTLSYKRGNEAYETTFNYTTNTAATRLMNIFEGLGRQQEHLATLERRARYDRLGLNDALLRLETDMNRKFIPEPERLLPVLETIANDSRVIEMARQRARALIERVRNPRPS